MKLSAISFIDLISKDQIVAQRLTDIFSEIPLTTISIDTRTIKKPYASNTIFFALQGESIDGNTFIDTAYENGVHLCIGTKNIEEIHIPDNCAYVQVEDTLATLQGIAQHYREKYISDTVVIGITGSVGKTTVKDLLKEALSYALPNEVILGTLGNLNNHIGVPLSILSIDQGVRCAVLEAGMNHRGEIALLAQIMQPDHVILTKIGVAHIEFLGSREEIAREKSDLAIYSPRIKSVYIPKTDEYTEFIFKYIKEKCENEIRFISVETYQNTLLDSLPSYITHNISLVLRCIFDIAYAYNPDIHIDQTEVIKYLLKSHITPRRFEVKNLSTHITLIDDSYNANPDSMKAGLGAFDSMSADHKIIILGGMAELGMESVNMHQDIFNLVSQMKNIDSIYLVGTLAEQYIFKNESSDHFQTALYFPTIKDAFAVIKKYIAGQITEGAHETGQKYQPEKTLIYIKGSKSTHMSDLADMISEYIQNSVK